MNEPQIIAALIQGTSGIVATIIAAVSAALIGRKFADQAKLKESLKLAVEDIEFLLAVEAAHCEIHREHSGSSLKLKVRESVRENGSCDYSGRFTRTTRKEIIGS